MIKGMTGFGSAQFSSENIKGSVEIKSLNHRYFDITYYLPAGFSSGEEKIRQRIQEDVARGRITVSVRITHKPTYNVSFNKDAVKQYLRQVQQLQKEFHFSGTLNLADVVKLPGVVETKEVVLDGELLWPAVEKALNSAMAGLVRMRQREGNSLRADIMRLLKLMLMRLKKIKARAKTVLAKRKKELTPEEFSSAQKSMDINEEVSRLAHYIEEMKNLLNKGGSIGKNIDFIAQEMQRETNTIGSKFQDQLASNAVIALKGKIEKIREQSQNIE